MPRRCTSRGEIAERVAPVVDKLRYNPGHLHHHEKSKSVEDKVAYLVGVARELGAALAHGAEVAAAEGGDERLERGVAGEVLREGRPARRRLRGARRHELPHQSLERRQPMLERGDPVGFAHAEPSVFGIGVSAVCIGTGSIRSAISPTSATATAER
jgi:hypothetical protein